MRAYYNEIDPYAARWLRWGHEIRNEWARSVIEQCKGAGVPACMKQLGSQAWLLDPKGGDPSEWPEDLRVREFPEPVKDLETV